VGLLFLSACSSASPTPTARPTAPFPTAEEVQEEKVSFTTEDDVKITATLFGDGSTVVILAHMGIAGVTEASWQPFARYIANLGYSALTINFRGRGTSEGTLDQHYLIYDMNAAIDFLRSRGYEKIVCMGASMGGTTCLRAAIDQHIAGLVVIASPFNIGIPTYVEPVEMESLEIPSLYITAEDDPYNVLIDMKVMAAKAPEPKQLVIYEGVSEHGTDLFYTKYGTEMRDLLIAYLNGLE
jgi:pimeloyl-ACP methyl ester carboxylesterase